MDDVKARDRASGRLTAVLGSGVGVDVVGTLILAGVSAVLAIGLNTFRTQPLPMIYQSRAQSMDRAVFRLENDSPAHAVEATPEELPHEIRLEEFQSFASEHRGLILDARPEVFYREAHVPGALNLPRETFPVAYESLRATLEASKDRPVAIYCSGADCPDSQLVGDALSKLGYRHLLIYTSGWDEWSQTGLPQEGASVRP